MISASQLMKASFKKKKDIDEPRPRIEEIKEVIVVKEEQLPVQKKKSQPEHPFLQQQLAKKETSKVEPNSSTNEIADGFKKSKVKAEKLKKMVIDLKPGSLRGIMKPPQAIFSLIEDEYDEIVSSENIALSLRSIRIYKQSSSSLRDSNIQKPEKVCLGRLFGEAGNKKSSKTEGVNTGQDIRLEEPWINIKPSLDSEPDAHVRKSTPSKFLRFSDYEEEQELERKPARSEGYRFKLGNAPNNRDDNQEHVDTSNKHPEENNSNELDESDNPPEFDDIFTPKGLENPAEARKRIFSSRRHEIDYEMFNKKADNGEDMLKIAQEKTLNDPKAKKSLNKVGVGRFDSDDLNDTNVFDLDQGDVQRYGNSKPPAKFNLETEGDYNTNDFNSGANHQSDKDLFENIRDLIDPKGAVVRSGDVLKNKKPTQESDIEETKETVKPSVSALNTRSPQSSLKKDMQPETMRRVMTFADVHQLAKPTVEDEKFIRNYYANKDYKEIGGDEDFNLIEEYASKDSIDVSNNSKRIPEENMYSIKSDRFSDAHIANLAPRFQSMTNQQAKDKPTVSQSIKVNMDALTNHNILINGERGELGQWDINYVSKDTQDIDNHILNEINAIYKNTAKVADPDSLSDNSEEENLKANMVGKLFPTSNRDNSFDEDERQSFEKQLNAEVNYFTLANMRVEEDFKGGEMPKRYDFNPDNSHEDSFIQLKSDFDKSDITPSIFGASAKKVKPKENKESLADPKPALKKLTSQEFEQKFNELIVRMLNKKAAVIQNYWRAKNAENPRGVTLADLFREFVRIKRRNENFVRKNYDMKGIQTSNYSIKLIAKDFTVYLDEVLYNAPNSGQLLSQVEDLSLLIKKLGVAGN